jgi:hypothetical protein
LIGNQSNVKVDIPAAHRYPRFSFGCDAGNGLPEVLTGGSDALQGMDKHGWHVLKTSFRNVQNRSRLKKYCSLPWNIENLPNL